MLSLYQDPTTNGIIRLIRSEAGFFRQFFDETIVAGQIQTGRNQRLLTIAWNTGPEQCITIDGIDFRTQGAAGLSAARVLIRRA